MICIFDTENVCLGKAKMRDRAPETKPSEDVEPQKHAKSLGTLGPF